MKMLGSLLLLFTLFSCVPQAVLITDAVFRASAPEVVKAWQNLPPWSAETVPLPLGGDMASLKTELNNIHAPTALVGEALSWAQRKDLTASFPKLRLVFFALPGEEETVSVERAAAWETVAKDAAKAGMAAVIFPSDATEAERARFASAWGSSGGGPLTSWVWPQMGAFAEGTAVVFQWVGAEADSRILALGSKVDIHGNPGTARPAGASGLTWAIKEAGLGDFLLQVVRESGKKTHFLPLESVRASR